LHFKPTAVRHYENFQLYQETLRQNMHIRRGREQEEIFVIYSVCHIFAFPRYSLCEINFYPLPARVRQTDATRGIDSHYLISIVVERKIFILRSMRRRIYLHKCNKLAKDARPLRRSSENDELIEFQLVFWRKKLYILRVSAYTWEL